MGVAAYNAECRKIVMRYSKEWEVRRCVSVWVCEFVSLYLYGYIFVHGERVSVSARESFPSSPLC